MMYSRRSFQMNEQRQDDKLESDTGCSPEGPPEAMDDCEGWRERIRNNRTDGVT